MIGVFDTETTGLHLRHGCKPFCISVTTETGLVRTVRGEVNPRNLEVTFTSKQIDQLNKLFQNPLINTWVAHNAPFDIKALLSIGVTPPPLNKLHCTQVGSHVVNSYESHSLKDLALVYLDINTDDEIKLDEACKDACKRAEILGWCTTAKRFEKLFGVKAPDSSFYKACKWLPRVLVEYWGLGKFHEWYRLNEEYIIMDCIRAYGMYKAILDHVKENKLEKVYNLRQETMRAALVMEENGLEINQSQLETISEAFKELVEEHRESICNFSPKNRISNPNSPDQIAKLLYETLQLPIISTGVDGKPSTSKDTILKLQETLSIEDPRQEFLSLVNQYRKSTKALQAVDSIQTLQTFNSKPRHRWDGTSWVLTKDPSGGKKAIYFNLGIANTHTTRGSSSSPNSQNFSKDEIYNTRSIIKPRDNSILVSIDYDNVELLLYAHVAKDEKLIKLFEEGKSFHLLVAEAFYPREFAKCAKDGVTFKERYKATLYQWIKNGNFAVIYGAREEKADITYRHKGGFNKLKQVITSLMPTIKAAEQEVVNHGYVTCLGGYRLSLPKKEKSKALNYKIQGTAGEIMNIAMVECNKYLLEVTKRTRKPHKILMNVHDELVFELPALRSSFPTIEELERIMSKAGESIGIPTKVSASICETDWQSQVDYLKWKKKFV